MVFAHPGHELTAVGLLMQLRPHLLFLTRSDSAGDTTREDVAREGLRRMGLDQQATFLGVGEHDIYRWLLRGEMDPLRQLQGRIAAWLDEVQPACVFGDAWELFNIVHDVGRVMLDSAWRSYRLETPCVNYEVPLVCRTEPDVWLLRYQEFPSGPFETLTLDAPVIALKRTLGDWAEQQWNEVAKVREFYSLDREVYREVPADRNYLTPPADLQIHFQEWGRLQVRRGKYAEAITFADHFVPFVRAMPRMVPEGATEAAAETAALRKVVSPPAPEKPAR
jgi:hypothetical protein